MFVLEYLLMGVWAYIVYQDFKFRAVSLWILAVFALVTIALNLYYIPFSAFMINTLLNLLILGIQFVVVTIYFSLKNKRFFNVINVQIGLGDIVFIAIMCALFSSLVFLLFLLTGLIFSLIGYFTISHFRSRGNTIPLAGILSITLFLIWVVKIITQTPQIYSIAFIENILMP